MTKSMPTPRDKAQSPSGGSRGGWTGATQLKHTCLACPSPEFHPGTNTQAWSHISEFKNQNGADEVDQYLRAVATFSVWFLASLLGSSQLPAMPVPWDLGPSSCLLWHLCIHEMHCIYSGTHTDTHKYILKRRFFLGPER